MPPAIAGYSNLKSFGVGGSGSVYTAFDETHNRTVAIKVLTISDLEDGGREIFSQELQTMGSVADHPNIVSLYHSGFTQNGQPYLVMPFYPQGSITQQLERSGPIAPSNIREFFKHLALGLQAAHGAGVLHCDIKPGNIMVNNFDGQPVLGDFGIAQAIHSVSSTGQISYTLNYAAPETLWGAPQTKQSDIYSLGATIYTIAAGRLPFEASDAQEMAHKILHEKPEPLSKDIPADVRELIMRMLKPIPDERPQTCDEVLASLETKKEPSIWSTVLLGAGLVATVFAAALLYIMSSNPEPEIVAAPVAEPESAWLVVDRTDDVNVRLEGVVKTEAEKEALIVAATATGLDVNADAVTVLPDLDHTSTFAIATLLEELINGSDDGLLILEDNMLAATGEAYDPVEAEEIQSAMAEVEETGLTVDDQTTIRVLPEDVQVVELQNEINQIFELARTIEGQSPNFEVSDGELSSGAKNTLDRVSVAMRRYPLPAANIVGHTDDVGSDEDNQELSKQRAQAVFDYLLETDIDSGRLTSIGQGETQPIADNSTEKGRNENRRVDFIVKSSSE